MLRKKSFEIKLLSVVIPAYKQENIIVRDVKEISEALSELKINYEIIVVVDGMVDKTYNKALALRSEKIKVLGYEKNQGKGYAVRYGMLKAKGDIVGFIDAGMDIHTAGLRMLLNHMEWYNADIIVGSKMHPVSQVKYPLYRKILSTGYRLLTTALFGFKVRDTQVGVKFLKSKVAKDVFPRLVVNRFAFDIEMLAVAYSLGYNRIFEAPVEIVFDEKKSSITSKNFWSVILNMLWDTFAVYYRLKVLNNYSFNNKNKL